MAENSGSGFMGVMVGALLVGVLVLGYFAVNGGFGQHHSVDINVSAPSIPHPG